MSAQVYEACNVLIDWLIDSQHPEKARLLDAVNGIRTQASIAMDEMNRDDEVPGERCTDPRGHDWNDDNYCVYCGADGCA